MTASTTSRPHQAPAAPDAPRAGQLAALVGVAVRDRLPLAGAVAALVLGLGLMAGSLWPSLQDTFADLPAEFEDILGALTGGSSGIDTPEGWIGAQVLSLVVPAGVIAAGVLSAARGVAGEEEDKTLGVLLSAPVGRGTFVLAKALAMVVHVLVVVLGAAAGLVLGDLAGDLGLAASGIVAVCLHAAGLGVLFGALALALAAVTGSRRSASVGAAGLAGLSLAAFFVLPLIDAVADLVKGSPWYWFLGPEPLAEGADVGYLLLLGVPAVVLTMLAVLAHRRRDLRG